MKTQASLSDLIRQTVEAVRQEEEQGLESLYLPEGLDGALPLPERSGLERPEGPGQSVRPGQPGQAGQPAGTGVSQPAARPTWRGQPTCRNRATCRYRTGGPTSRDRG